MALNRYVEMIVRGTSPLSLPDAIADSLSYVKAFGGTEQEAETIIQTATAQGKTVQGLPDGYTQLEYIESTGTQYIDTGITNENCDSYGVKTKYNYTANTANSLCGNYEAGTGKASFGQIYYDGSTSAVYSGISNVPKVNFSSITTGTDYTDEFSIDTSTGAITRTLNGTTMTKTGLNFGTRSDKHCLLFACNTGNGAAQFGKEKIYYFQILKDGSLVRDFVPCKNASNVVGMYDTVSGTFFTNAGTGTFTAGNAVTPTPDAPIDIWCNNGVLKVSKNLINVSADTVTVGEYTDASGNVASDSQSFQTSVFPVLPNTTYTASSGVATTMLRVCEYNSSKTFIIRQNTPLNSGETTLTFTTTANTYYVNIGANVNGSSITLQDVLDITWQIEQGSTATPYMPYGAIYTDGTQETVIDNIGNVAICENLLKVDTYTDTQEILTGAVTHNVGIVVLDGTENWTAGATGRYYVSISNQYVKSTYAPLCTHFPMSTNTGGTGNITTPDTLALYTGAVDVYQIYAYPSTTTANSLVAWKTWLANQYAAGTPVIIVFPLATATTESVTGQNLRKQPLTVTGSLPNLLVNTTTTDVGPTPDAPMDIVSNNGVLKARHQSGLPLGYTLLEYIQSSGTQYIDTGYVPNANTKIRIHGIQGKTDCALFGVSLIFYCFSNNPTALHYSIAGSSNTLGVNIQGLDATIVMSATDGLVINGTQLATITPGSSTANYSMALFGRIDNTSGNIAKLGSHRIYSCELWDNGVLVRNFVPAKRNSGNAIGMYDTVTGTFFTNQGTGTFTAGNAVSDPVEIYTDGTVETINVHGKNLFDGQWRQGTIGDPTAANRICSANYIPVLPNTKYTFHSLDSATQWRIYFYNANKERTTLISGEATVTTTADTRYIKFFIAANYTLATAPTVQVELGSTATNYQPYFDGGTATAEMLLKVGDYQDVQSIIDGVVTRNVGVKVLDGTENWIVNSMISHHFTYKLPNQFDSTAAYVPTYCTHFLSDSGNDDNTCKLQYRTFSIRYDAANENTTTFKQWLAAQYAAGTPVIVIYPLETPTTESVTGQALQVQDGDNTLEITQASLSGLELEAEYKKRK